MLLINIPGALLATVSKLASILNAEGRTTKEDKPSRPMQVKMILD